VNRSAGGTHEAGASFSWTPIQLFCCSGRPPTVHGMDFLLPRNCAHIVNAALRPQLDELSWKARHRPPIICTPLELQGSDAP